MSGRLISFGDYNFPVTQKKYSTNFADQQSKTMQLAGMDGAYDFYGDGRAPSPKGSTPFSYSLRTDNPEDMNVLLDNVRLMQSYGLAKLVRQPRDEALAERWTWARAIKIKISENFDNNPGYWQDVSITFEVPEPVWWVDSYVGWTWGDGWKWSDPGHVWGGSGFVINAFDAGDPVVIPNNGNTESIPHIVVATGPGQSFDGIAIQRLDGLFPVEQIQYNGKLLPGQVLDIDGRRQLITVDGSPVWDDVDIETTSFFHLLSGNNNVQVILGDSGEAAPSVAYDIGSNNLDGSYNNVVVEGGYGTYNGSTSYTDLISAGLIAAFDPEEFSIISKQRTSSLVDDWTDGNERYCDEFSADANNRFSMFKASSNNTFSWDYVANSVVSSIDKSAITTTDDFVTGASTSLSAGGSGEFSAYYNGAQEGITQVGLGTWAGALSTALVGAFAASSDVWNNRIGDCLVTLNSVVLDGAQHQAISDAMLDESISAPMLNTLIGAGNWAWWRMHESTDGADVTFYFRDSYR